MNNNINQNKLNIDSAEQSKSEHPGLYQKLKDKGIIRPYTLFTAIFFLVSLLIYILSRCFKPFAEFWSRYPSQAFRFLFAEISDIIPFSIAEMILILLPFTAVIYTVISVKKINKSENSRAFYDRLMPLVCLILLIFGYFFSAFGPCYFRNGLDENLGLSKEKLSAEDLKQAAIYLCEELKDSKSKIAYDEDGQSRMPYSFHEMNKKLNDAFRKYAADKDYISSFNSNVKQVILSEPMTYTHISGVYSFFTGESNVNINFPDFCTPYTTAHEMSHQRGIAREDEANFIAYLVCTESDDEYIRYSANVNMLQYISGALNKADRKIYSETYSMYFPEEIKKELSAYSKFFEKYRDSVASDVTGSVNDGFLQSQGQSEGTASYGLVVDLFAAYLKSNGIIK